MKKIITFACLALGFMVTSCQSELEVVMNESDVMPVAATTRTSIDDHDTLVQEVSLEKAYNITLTGDRIIQGYNQSTYSVSGIVSGTNLVWGYDHSVVDSIGSTTAGITLKLKNASSTADTYVTAKFVNPVTHAIVHSITMNVGANGPHYADCSIRVVRSSDGVEAYPSSYGLRPNTWYYGYFSTTTGASLSLRWDFTYSSCSSSTGTPVYFKSGANGYDIVNVYGTLSGSSVEKLLLGVTLYGGSGKKGIKEKESDEEEDGEEDDNEEPEEDSEIITEEE